MGLSFYKWGDLLTYNLQLVFRAITVMCFVICHNIQSCLIGHGAGHVPINGRCVCTSTQIQMLIIMRMETRLRGQQGNQRIKSFNWILAVENGYL